jgi:hypothetical protein
VKRILMLSKCTVQQLKKTSGAVDWFWSLKLKFLNICKENMVNVNPMSVSCHVLNNKCYNRPNVFLRDLEAGLNRSQSMIRKKREIFVVCWLRYLTKLSMSKVMSSVVDEWMGIDHWWNDRERGELRQFKRNFSHCNFYNPMDRPEREPGPLWWEAEK